MAKVKVAVCTDTGAAFPKEWYSDNGIYVAQLSVTLPKENNLPRENVLDFNMPQEAFVSIMREAEAQAKEVKKSPFVFVDKQLRQLWISEMHKFLPGTAGANSEEYTEIFDRAFSEGAEDVIVFTISKDLSSTYTAAEDAKSGHKKKKNIHIRDTFTVGPAPGFMAKRVKEYAEIQKDYNIDQILKYADGLIPYTRMLAVPRDLHVLVAGGRVQASKEFFGGVLKINPLLSVKFKESENKYSVDQIGRVRGSGLDQIVSQVGSDIDNFVKRGKKVESVDFMAMHTDNEAICDKLYNLIQEKLASKGIHEGESGKGALPNALTAHLGLGGVGTSLLYVIKK